ncbi:RagB/SusD domain-containing protein [Chitinophaga niastensis]|uniref:RagB/SusD domain-containing protein n=1 Tax=Chitinophaga niastensis TaxID=536980 RepID=A0A2P8HHJ3_CHINA|nr:RagB/SusD family nutrient uptake outer membrane protein [Chitinophaga niastensis]PSL45686.1 RagB/SusD domain-containing protein [Chitinophaga niastensis]
MSELITYLKEFKMQLINKIIYKHRFISVCSAWTTAGGIFLFLLIQTGCKKLVEVDAPFTSINVGNVYTNDATAVAVLTGIYTKMSLSDVRFSDGGLISLSLFPGLSSDELTLYNLSNENERQYYSNALNNLNNIDFWVEIYPIIFIANSAIESLTNATGLTPVVKQQLIGEAKFIRAFCYFYLVNLYGDVPLVTGTDYTINALLSRTSMTKVWEQIVTDLKDAQSLLSTNYLDATLLNVTTEKVRPTKWAATALLARAYLYIGDEVQAEAQATVVINNSSLYSLDTLNSVFLKNSNEAIWQLQPVGAGVAANTGAGRLFILPAGGPNLFDHPVYLSDNITNSFETGDQRKTSWVNSITVSGATYYYPYKYKIGAVNTSTNEYIMVLRLGEQYLVRAEARAQQGNIAGAAADLNIIRTRAGLMNTTAATQVGLLAAIQRERKVELFTEWGHRWLDLKRTNMVDAVMSEVTPQKGGTWNTNWQWYPIILSELKANPNLVQNIGY